MPWASCGWLSGTSVAMMTVGVVGVGGCIFQNVNYTTDGRTWTEGQKSKGVWKKKKHTRKKRGNATAGWEGTGQGQRPGHQSVVPYLTNEPPVVPPFRESDHGFSNFHDSFLGVMTWMTFPPPDVCNSVHPFFPSTNIGPRWEIVLYID
jgi:hypothetical protein